MAAVQYNSPVTHLPMAYANLGPVEESIRALARPVVGLENALEERFYRVAQALSVPGAYSDFSATPEGIGRHLAVTEPVLNETLRVFAELGLVDVNMQSAKVSLTEQGYLAYGAVAPKYAAIWS